MTTETQKKPQTVAGAGLTEERVRELIASFEHWVRYSDLNETDGYVKDEVMISRRVLIEAVLSTRPSPQDGAIKLRLPFQIKRDGESFVLIDSCEHVVGMIYLRKYAEEIIRVLNNSGGCRGEGE